MNEPLGLLLTSETRGNHPPPLSLPPCSPVGADLCLVLGKTGSLPRGAGSGAGEAGVRPMQGPRGRVYMDWRFWNAQWDG